MLRNFDFTFKAVEIFRLFSFSKIKGRFLNEFYTQLTATTGNFKSHVFSRLGDLTGIIQQCLISLIDVK